MADRLLLESGDFLLLETGDKLLLESSGAAASILRQIVGHGDLEMRDVKKGATDQSVVIRIVDSADGTPETGVVFNTSGIDLWYRREGATKTSITEATLSALNDAHSDGGILHIGDGYYRVDLPDAAFATGANGVMIGGTVTGMVVIGCYVGLVDYDPQDTVRLGLTALPNAAAEASGGLYTRGTGAGQLSQSANGELGVATLVSGSVGSVTAGVTLAASAVQAIWDALTSALTTVGSIGKLLVDNINATIGSRATQTSVDDVPTNAELATALAAADDAVLAAIAALNNLSQANIRTAIGLASANLDTQLDALPTNAELATALGTADDAILAAIAALNNLSAAQAQTAAAAALTAYDPPTHAELTSGLSGLSIPTAVQNADALLGRTIAGGANGGRMVKDALRFNRNKFTIAGGTLTVYEEDDTTVAWTATITQSAGDPVSASDPG